MKINNTQSERKLYRVEKIENPFEKLESIQEIIIDSYPWDKTYMPRTFAKIFYTSRGMHVFFKSYEKRITATYLQTNDPVYLDSCVEFFFNPNPEKDKRYFNLEMNPFGTFLIGIGEGRYDRKRIDDLSPEILQVSTSVTPQTIDNYSGDFWTVQYTIPFSFIEKYYGKLQVGTGYKMKANLYKCGDETFYPHFGSWNPINLEKADFHCPEFFGDLVFG